MSSALTSRDSAVVRGRVVVASAEDWLSEVLVAQLEGAGFAVECSSTGDALRSATAESEIDVVLFDVASLDSAHRDPLQEIERAAAQARVVLLVGKDDEETLRAALERGICDYLAKPLDPLRVASTVALAARVTQLERENRKLTQRLNSASSGDDLVGCSPALRRLATVVARAADSDATVLIEGASGSGKTMVAELIHSRGRRCSQPLLTVGGGAVGDTMDGLLEQTQGGTLLIEEVDLLSAAAQARLVRYLKERPARAAGASTDVRLLTTTSARLPELVAHGAFREDLFYRLNALPIVVPALHERRDDVPVLAAHFLREAAAESGVLTQGFTAAAMILLEAHPWPNNVEQLRNAVHRAHALAGGATVDRQHLLGPSTGLDADVVEPLVKRSTQLDDDEAVPSEADIEPLATEEKRLLARALRATEGNVRRAAQLLRIGRATLYRKIQVYDLRLR